MKFVRNLKGQVGTAPMQLHGLVRGDLLQFQANVRGLDGNRTDVVTVTETVKRRPDLGIRVAAAPAAHPGVPTVIMATVTEHNGDMGARADCELLVDGVVADDARGIWVDAGDAVSCAFTQRFPAAGSYRLTARVQTAGADWDDSNNLDQTTLTVRAASGEPTRFTTEARFEQYIYSDTSWRSTSWRDLTAGTAGESGEVYAWGDWNGMSVMHGFLERGIPGPVRFEASHAFGGAPVTGAWDGEQAGYNWCADFWAAGALYVCSSGDAASGHTTVQYWTYAPWGATYHSIQYGRAWDEATGAERYSYHWDYGEYVNGERPLPLGDRYTWRVRMLAADGEYLAEETLPLRSARDEYRPARECWTDEWPDFVENVCETRVSVMEWTESY